jgi:signal transduction histidine kinase
VDIAVTRGEVGEVDRGWEFLAQASALLDQSLDYQATLTNVVQLAVPRIADYCTVGLLDDDGLMTWAASAHRDETRAQLAQQLRAYSPDMTSPTSTHPVAEAFRRGVTQLISPVDESFLRGIARDETHLALLRELAPASYIAVPMSARARILGLLVFATTTDSGRCYAQRDLTLANELGHRAALAVDRATLYRAADQAGRAREAMVSVVSHDLKNPISTIQMAVSFLLDEVVPSDQAHDVERRQLQAVRRATSRMYRLIHDLLDVTAIEAGKFRVECCPEAVAPVVNEALESLQALAEAKRIELAAEAPRELPPVVADRDRLLQVFSNLGGNAIKFTPDGGRVTIRVSRARDAVEFSVVDTGPGIAAADLPRVFDRFWQATKTARSGTGLGLAIAKGIVEAHGGRIGVTSVPGQGSTFCFSIPAAASGVAVVET